ncbi:MAG: DNA polymerase III subunit alpha [Thermoflavifilum sp.]|nr:DNA polymerase III subunit alpha [Thermoflavifilum sp.]
MPKFSHLHVHTQYSLLDGASAISQLYQKAIADQMPALAITDHGNMFGVFQFVAEAYQHKLHPDDPQDQRLKVKPIVGCEFYVVEDRFKRQFTREERDQRYHQVLLAKNEQGYRNLVKLCSLGYIEGLYGKYPRIDKSLIEQYHEGLIATTCCLAASVPRMILKKGEEQAEQEFRWWLNIFGDDYYIELQRHGIPEQDRVNAVLLKWAKKYQVKTIATNDAHYVDQDDYNAHDILLCINTGEKKSTPAIKEFTDDDVVVRNKRFAFYNDQFYLKTTEEMNRLFADVPEAIDYTNEIVDKVELLDLKRQILLPHFPLPQGFLTQDQYLRHLTYEGARKRYHELTPEIEQRIAFELETIEKMGFAGYFLIVSDFIKAARDLGVFVGPGRGSAAGSVVAYCIGITNIDPIKYNLLFERFLNPDRKSMPDIDTDFDDEGRQKVIDYVVKKYGRNQVAQIITYGTMAARMSIKDVARVLDLPLPEANALARLVPERPGISLKRLLQAPIEGSDGLIEKEGLRPQEIDAVKQLREIAAGHDLRASVLKEAAILEGSVRNTGIHAAGIIIAPTDLTELIPVCTSKETDLLITQYEGSIIEHAGVIKMDFLGLKTLSIIKQTLEMIRKNHHEEIDIDHIPLDDPKTYELYQKGETNGTFQFESPGMQKYLRELKPDKFDDLIAMNALYRPGPLEYIPDFIRRKLGLDPVTYDLPEMEEYLKETYGITVYQEQVMLLSQKLAGFSKGDADTLRKAMGKKQKAVLDKMKTKFIEGCKRNGHDLKICEKIWGDWEAFASYAFNKSHATCYAFVAFQTAYLKAHYPAEYMASVLNHASSIEKITFFMEECKRMGLKVLGPDINESDKGFAVNAKGEIRFGLAGIKGVGEAVVEAILQERTAHGHFRSVFDLVKRVGTRHANRKALECLAMSGAFDCFTDVHRAQYFYKSDRDQSTGLEKIIRYASQHQATAIQQSASLFGEQVVDETPAPQLPDCQPWSLIEQLEKEKEVIGVYISGHPLDHYRFELSHYPITPLEELNQFIQQLNEQPNGNGKETNFRIAGFIAEAAHRTSKKGNKFGTMVLEDYTAKTDIVLLGDDYLKFKAFLEPGLCVYIQGVVKPRYQGNYEFFVQQICLLEEVKHKLTRSVTLYLTPADINEQMVAFFSHHVQAHPGRVPLYIQIDDKLHANRVKLHANRHIELNDELIQFLEQAKIDAQVTIHNG